MAVLLRRAFKMNVKDVAATKQVRLKSKVNFDENENA